MATLLSSPFQLLKKILIFTLLASVLAGCGSQKTIVNGLDEKEANEILVYLAAKGIDANKVPAATSDAGGAGKEVLWNITVDSGQSIEAMALLNQVGLPRRRGQNLLGIFSTSSLVPSGMQEKVRYQSGLAEQIASTIRKIDGILDADVQISFPEEDPLNPTAPKGKITASVYVKHNGILDDPNSHLVTRIKRLVAGSITGLDYDNVTVIGDRARYGEAPGGGIGGMVGEPEKHYVSVWSLILAQESLFRFQLIFFSFIILLIILLLFLVWVLWKVHLLLKPVGGFRSLFTLHALHPEEKPAVEEQPKENPEAKKSDESEPPSGGVDET